MKEIVVRDTAVADVHLDFIRGRDEMKSSYYNFYIGMEKDFVIFNGLTGAIAVADRDLKENLENGNVGKIPEDYREQLYKNGFIIDDDLDEAEVFNHCHNMQKYSTNHLGLTVLTTYACNLRCPYCYEGQEKDTKHMDDRVADRIVSFVKQSKSRTVSLELYGGEPFLNKRIALKLIGEISEICKAEDRTFHLGCITNGTLLDDEIIKKLSEYNASMQITLDGPKDLHDRSRFYSGGRGTYEEIMENVRKMKGSNINFHFRISVTKETYPRIEEVLIDLENRGLKEIPVDFGIITAWTEACRSFADKCLADDELIDLFPFLWDLALKHGFTTFAKPHQMFVSCGSVTYNSYVIDPYGRVFKCWDFVGDENLVCGELNDDGSIKFRPNYYSIMTRNPVEIAECRECKILPLCGGGCMAKAYYDTKSYHSKYCDVGHKLIDRKILLYLQKRYPESFANGAYRWKGG